MVNLKQCKKCEQSIAKSSLKLLCGDCRGYYHLRCGKVDEVDARIMIENKAPWRRPLCENDIEIDNLRKTQQRKSLLVTQQSSSPSRSTEELELKEMIRDLQKEMRECRKSVDFISQMYEEEKKRTKALSVMVNEISRENRTLKEEVEKLKSVRNKEENKKLDKNLCITGLISDESDKENLQNKLHSLFQALEVTVPESEYKVLENIETRNGMKTVISLENKDKKYVILKARAKKGKITTSSVGVGDENTPIYINEDMSKDTYTLFKKAKELKNVDYKHVWHRDGKILARKNDNDKPVHIKNEAMLDELLG
ncbi:unnamed protein product [Ceutorhynchus assimilis]|uniref:FP protein C-terminal domain-containing protein n=1 Tax=Ceutorhynchus assimilis TaxID=467358 RepID=A0A9N9MWR9_9CUCU|nr:unnamed protein product [Ceutorhynchus assimilis]